MLIRQSTFIVIFISFIVTIDVIVDGKPPDVTDSSTTKADWVSPNLEFD